VIIGGIHGKKSLPKGHLPELKAVTKAVRYQVTLTEFAQFGFCTVIEQ
jgi:hypothetical protein